MRIKIYATILFCFHAFIISAQKNTSVRQLAYADSARLVGIYKDIHQNPEPAFMEFRTSGIVMHELKRLGFDVHAGIGRTGVVGILKNGKGPVVIFRADMDCNSIQETTGLPYASTGKVKRADGSEVPVMHACGHDAHVTWMLGIARSMIALKSDWKGTLVMIGQPAEEIGAGAKAMVADSLYQNLVPRPDYLLAMHAWPYPVGSIINRANEAMSGVDFLDVEFYGTGGHGAMPETTRDPVLMVCNAVLQYQTIISRQISAHDVAVLTVGAIQSGVDNNVIPSKAIAKISFRWFNEKTRSTILEGIKKINEGIAVANGLPKDKYPVIIMKTNIKPVINNVILRDRINQQIIRTMPGSKIYTELPPIMAAEDVHYLVMDNQKTVYNYMLLGIASQSDFDAAIISGKSLPYSNHSSDFKVDLAAIPKGVEVGTNVLLELFKKD